MPCPNPTRINAGSRIAASIGTFSLISMLAGCALGTGSNAISTSAATAVVAATTATGHVHGGNQPISGATIQMYYAGTPATGSGYGIGATPLLPTGANAILTDANGNFSITGKYTCPSTASQLYIVSTGGNPGLTPTPPATTVNNASIALMAALGTCPANGNLLASIPQIDITEVTTVAAVWALQQFMAAPATANTLQPVIGAPTTSYATGTTLGSVQSGVIGMTNAFVTAKVMADISTGLTPNLNYAYATPEAGKINTIADILAFCVNSDPTQSTNCTQLMSAATPSGKTAAADTIQASWYMAQNPINNLTALYNFVAGAGSPFQPVYLAPMTLNTAATGPATNAFNDTTIAINYAPIVASTALPAVGAAYGVAIDAFGNAWLDNAGGIGGTSASAVELGIDGSALTIPATTYVASATSGSTPQFTTAPTTNTRTFSAPRGIAVDLADRAWIANSLDAITATTAGAVASSVGVFTGSTLSGAAGIGGGTGSTGFYVGDTPYGLAIDGSNNVYVVNTASPGTAVLDGASLALLTSSPGTAADGTYSYSTSTTTGAPSRTPGGGTEFIAIDKNPNVSGGIVWVGDSNACKIQGQYNTATYFGTVGQYTGGTLAPLAGSDAVSAYSNATVGAGSGTNCGSSSTYVGQTFTAPSSSITGLATDRNNGLWIVNILTSSNGFDGLTYLAAPTASTGISTTSYGLVNGVLPTATGAGVSGTTFTKAGGAAIDGNNNVWIGNQSAKSVVEAAIVNGAISLLTPGQGSAYGSTGAAYGIGFVHNTSASFELAVDPSGNVWVPNNTTSGTYTNQAAGTTNTGNSVTVIVGAAGPVVTPMALALKAGKVGSKP